MAERSKITGAIGSGLSGAASGSAFGPIGTGIGAALGVATGFLSGGGENRAMNLARQQAELYRLESEENRRRMDVERQMVTGQSRAATAASNLQNLYTPAAYTDALETTYLGDMAYESLAGSLRQRMALNQGQAAASDIRRYGIQSMLRGVSDAAGVFGPGLLDRFRPEKRTLGGINVGGWMDAERGS